MVCLLGAVAVPASGESCNMWQHSPLKLAIYRGPGTFSATPFHYTLHSATAAATGIVTLSNMQCSPICSYVHTPFPNKQQC
jgi:hypothetical protein